MKRTIFALVSAALLAWLTGCASPSGGCLAGLLHGSCQKAPENCASCDNGGDPDCEFCRGRGCDRCRDRCRGHACEGPSTGAITYPYYTVRGPRDYLAKNPPSIGP